MPNHLEWDVIKAPVGVMCMWPNTFVYIVYVDLEGNHQSFRDLTKYRLSGEERVCSHCSTGQGETEMLFLLSDSFST